MDEGQVTRDQVGERRCMNQECDNVEQKEGGVCGDSNDSLENKEFINGNIVESKFIFLSRKS